MSTRPRFFYNDDGDRPFYICRGPFRMQHLYDPVDILVGTGVTTLCYCVGADQVYYPSQVASQPGWRHTPSVDTSPVFRRWHEVANEVRERGIDVIRVIMERAAEQGLEFIPSLRMNDGHFAYKIHPTEHPFTCRFWMEHQDLTLVRADPSLTGWQGFVFDWTHQEVRDYRMAQIEEIIDGYAADGFEMDFTRHYMLFPPGKQQPELVTEMVRRTRARLDERARRVGKPLLLIVRTPASLALCAEEGLDVSTWIRDDLVDYVVPSSPSRNVTYDMPLEEFLELARGSRCQVAASPETLSTRGDNQLTPEQYRGAIANYYAMGQHATYLFNFFTLGYYPFTDQAYGILRDVASPVTLRGRDKHFMATGEAWHGPALPQTLDEVGRPVGVCLFVGDDLAQAHEDNILLNVELQVRIEGYQLEDDVTIALNERPLDLSSASVEWPPLDEFRRQDNESVWEQRVTEGPFAVMSLQLTESLPLVGVNTVSVTLNQSPRTGGALRITAVDLLARYDILGVDTALPGDA